jgi:hypothetical protein
MSEGGAHEQAGEAPEPGAGFVACIEGGALETQALLLFESIRLFGGRFAGCAAYAFSPRRGHAVSRAARARLEELGVRHVEDELNTRCPEYGSANRVAAAAYAEENFGHELLVVLDSDTLFLREPVELLLPPGVDAAARPVDLKGMCTDGPDDPFDGYWRALCRSSGVEYERVPWGESFVDRRRIKACYNAGLVVARAGILGRWADFFFKSIGEGLSPHREGRGFRAGAGWVGPAAARFWGSNQAALSLAVWGAARDFRLLPPSYNYPLHLHERVEASERRVALAGLVHVHYHWLLEEDPAANPLLREPLALAPEQAEWLRSAAARVRAASSPRPWSRLLRRLRRR